MVPLLWIGAALLGVGGLAAAIDAKDTFSAAKRIGERARRKHENVLSELESLRSEVNSDLENLGKLKISIFKNQIAHLVNVIRKYAPSRSVLKNFQVSISTEEFRKMEQLVLGAFEIEKGLASGVSTGALAAVGAYGSVGMLATASTGTAISGLSGVAATNATLAWFGGGSLAAGGFGMTGGAFALAGVVLGPALAITGFMMSSKADKALTEACEYESDVDIKVAKLDQTKVVLNSLREYTGEMTSALIHLAERFDAIKVSDDRNRNSFEKMVVVGKSLKGLLDIPIMSGDGTPTEGIKSKISGYIEV